MICLFSDKSIANCIFMAQCQKICVFCNSVLFIIIFSTIMLSLMIHFHVYSNAKKPSCFYPIPQAADCILRVVEMADAPIIYLSTDAAESETGLLQSLVVLNGRPVPLVIRPARNSAEKWDALLYRHRMLINNNLITLFTFSPIG